MEALKVQIDAVRARTQALVSGLTPDQLMLRPSPSSWSIAECLAHLNLTAAVIQPRINAAIDCGRKREITGAGPFSPGVVGRLLFWVAEPPLKFRLRAPKKIVPQVTGDNPSQVVREFMNVQDGWEKLVRDSEGLDQNRIKVASFPGLPLMRLSGMIRWMLAHQRRHLLQAETARGQITQSFRAKV